ncbi:hypothetical protein AW729_04785 [Methanosphaera sp. BMS]|nr:hypothetical protein AW729_04785 [Methanosphaera sp. BMS]
MNLFECKYSLTFLIANQREINKFINNQRLQVSYNIKLMNQEKYWKHLKYQKIEQDMHAWQ